MKHFLALALLSLAILSFSETKKIGLTLMEDNNEEEISNEVNTAVTLADILKASDNAYNFLTTKHGIPYNITVGPVNIQKPVFSYVAALAIKDLNAGKTSGSYTIKTITKNTDLNGDWISSKVLQKDYVTVAGNVANYMDKNKAAPNYATLPEDKKKADFHCYTGSFIKILHYYNTNKALPSYCIFTNEDFQSIYATEKLKKKKGAQLTFYLTTDNIISKSTDNAALTKLKNALISWGYKAKVIGVGPNYHNIAYKYGCVGENSVLLNCFGGVDVGCIEEWAGELGKWFPLAYKGAHIFPVFYTDPYGVAANIHDHIDKAWDADYGWSLDDPAKYMEDHGLNYLQTGTVDSAVAMLKKIFAP